MIVYTYDKTTFKHIGWITVADLLSAPANTTDLVPPTPLAGNEVKFIEGAWAQVPITVENLDAYKEKKIQDLDNSCESEILAGFESSALGTPHFYQSSRDDQMNLIGLVATGDDDLFKCDDYTSIAYRLHTAAQLKQVIVDGKNIKLTILTKFNTLKGQVLAATTQAEIDAIVW